MKNTKKFLLFLVILSGIILVSCTSKPVCNKPYILVGNECCLDKDSNNICDKDEIKQNTQKIETLPPPNKSNEIIIDKKEFAQTIALRFARVWEKKDWASMYDFFVDDLKNLKSKERFVKIINKAETETNVVVRLDKVELDNDTTAFAYYTITSSLFEFKAPSMRLEWDGKDWKVNAFATYFNACDKYIKNCCGNGLCEKGERAYLDNGATYNGNWCNLDCLEYEGSIYKDNHEITLYFLGEVYPIKIIKFSEQNPETLKLKYNDVEFTLNESGYRDYDNGYNLINNIYIKYRYDDHYKGKSIIFTMFNNDQIFAGD
ncbi:MAG TPA: hypothetical protein VJJ52_07390 [Candidatus Nanoarchaeia archaeon]|nr:hypothetical protein [Candidatus Nanoarchaeia archaeon]